MVNQQLFVTRVAVGGALAAVFGLLGLSAVVVAAIVGLASTGLGAGWGTAIVGGALLVASASAAVSIRRPAAKMLAAREAAPQLPEQEPRALGEGEPSRQAPERQGGPS